MSRLQAALAALEPVTLPELRVGLLLWALLGALGGGGIYGIYGGGIHIWMYMICYEAEKATKQVADWPPSRYIPVIHFGSPNILIDRITTIYWIDWKECMWCVGLLFFEICFFFFWGSCSHTVPGDHWHGPMRRRHRCRRIVSIIQLPMWLRHVQDIICIILAWIHQSMVTSKRPYQKQIQLQKKEPQTQRCRHSEEPKTVFYVCWKSVCSYLHCQEKCSKVILCDHLKYIL